MDQKHLFEAVMYVHTTEEILPITCSKIGFCSLKVVV